MSYWYTIIGNNSRYFLETNISPPEAKALLQDYLRTARIPTPRGYARHIQRLGRMSVQLMRLPIIHADAIIDVDAGSVSYIA